MGAMPVQFGSQAGVTDHESNLIQEALTLFVRSVPGELRKFVLINVKSVLTSASSVSSKCHLESMSPNQIRLAL